MQHEDENNGSIILLPHPYGERLPTKNQTHMGWPLNDKHARKFLRSRGEWVTKHSVRRKGYLEFWCEYEAPTFCEFIENKNDLYPHAVQEPDPDFGAPGLNTDPWVFHPGFVWSVCRHASVRKEINPGDVVLFGSSIRGEWYLDTVMVIKERLRGGHGVIGGIYDDLILPELKDPYQPFIGKAYSSLDEPFSFVPAKPADKEHNPFPRPMVSSLLGLLRKQSDRQPPSPKNCQSLVYCSYVDGSEAFWHRVLKLVHDEELVAGVSIDHIS